MHVSIAGLVLLWAAVFASVGLLRLFGVKKLSCPLLSVEFLPKLPKQRKPPKGCGGADDTG